ncbi:uncharacterized protein TRIVIDRAFT_177900 [Trichoderma virens Gv29-8]|uniref:F-box domain-containing protein n=1 Tax=Hypocrea virens (strain Gv29-8 / FGSC 10586) TaxID=413071 RepID=G9MLR1_HYPVG|nr:uncharacterized protein TRIVIDRAFT_177900 [Trichoderma virens Gv29-8]EHK24288.1 hypothetical protein TRIVIDRAFT_177900 [Trichoderma virens Gv29-8]UKZ54552.1 hypothetical protein TrVGV298_008361 [Trichoderma virens]
MSEHPSKSTGRRPSLTKPPPPAAPRKAQATAKKSQVAAHKSHVIMGKPQATMQKPQALATSPQSPEQDLQPPEQEPQAPAPGSIDDEINNISIASLTLDTPLIPLRKKAPRVPATPFHFLSLPSELRVKIYEYYFEDDGEVLDLSPENYKRIHKKLGLMRVCRLLHEEATYYYYGTRTFRLFPTYPGKYFKSKRPLLARLKPRQRECLTTLELRLGPGWNAPPKGWAVNDALGLKDCINVHKLKVLVECDPSDGIFKGFRRSEGFYEAFSRTLLGNVIASLPAVSTVEFDAWSSVKKKGNMMSGLIKVAAEANGVTIRWGPERGWTDADEEEELTATVAGPDPNRPLESVPIQGFGNSHNIMVVA